MEFKESLNKGCRFEEDICLPFLTKAFSKHWIVPTHDHKLSKFGNAYYGPRMHTVGGQSLILPDFQLFGSPNLWIEAKNKSNPFSIKGHYLKKFIAIEEMKCMQYEEVAKITGFSLMYLIGCDATESLHLVDPYVHLHHRFANNFGDGPLYAFEINDENRAGSYR